MGIKKIPIDTKLVEKINRTGRINATTGGEQEPVI